MATAQVVVLDSIDEDVFICGICKLVFNSMQLFIDHKNISCAKEIPNLKGTLQSTNSVNDSILLTPCSNQTKPGTKTDTFSCSLCYKTFKKMKCLHTHQKSHERLSQCPVCGRCFENNSHLKRHITTHKVWLDGLTATTPKSSDVELLSYSCAYCDSVLANYSQFRAHLNNHLTLKKFKCIQGDCNSFFETVSDLLCHVSNTHTIPKYICHMCKKSFHSLDDIGIHHQNHKTSGEKDVKTAQIDKFKCTLCDATFRKQEKLFLHMHTENHNKACIHCSKKFVSDKRLRMHLQVHKKSKPYECNICTKSFHMKKYLTSHMLKHGESRFTCEICKHTFRRQDVLHRHMKIHQARKFFKCPFNDITGCVKEFSRRDKLKEHLKSHTKKLSSPINTQILPSAIAGSTSTMEICIVPLEALAVTNSENE